MPQRQSLTDRFQEALSLAFVLHREQIRKGSGEPYIAHLLSTCALVLESGGDEDEAIAALLHDAVEDQGGLAALVRIRRQFGDRVAEIVLGCSDTYERPKPPWQGRKEHHLATLSSAPPSVLRVVVADKLHNARALLRDYRTFGEPLWERFRGGKDGTLWYYQEICERLRALGLQGQAEELYRVVDELVALTSPTIRTSASIT
jgi:(p)ppGpp synthase/HD superfamily hydrolase